MGAKSEIYTLMNELTREGKSIIMISSELPEILRMSDRILVMSEGRLTGELPIEEASQEAIMGYATIGHQAVLAGADSMADMTLEISRMQRFRERGLKWVLAPGSPGHPLRLFRAYSGATTSPIPPW